MMNIICISFVMIFSMFLLHEMDAIRTKEWKMFIILKDMKDESAYKHFSIIHLPLYFFIIYFILKARVHGYLLPYIIIDILFVLHAIIHFCFRKNKANGFLSLYSKILIYLIGALALIHLFMIYMQ